MWRGPGGYVFGGVDGRVEGADCGAGVAEREVFKHCDGGDCDCDDDDVC